MSDLVRALRSRATWETATGIAEPQEHIDWMAADEITRLREEIGRLTMALAEAEARAERDYLRFVEADREEIERLREQIRLLTEDMPAGDARRILAEQRAEIHELLKTCHKQSEEIARLRAIIEGKAK